ncbi:P-loop NTPase fold protein [Methylovulum psychrotolerans]|uniref:KAP NTPase domain-containing protein n=1 Tax=Methylovulum psychrotolerans TaxID=1704499 RepID=A0A1Z4BXD4_9GAMM|nr:P-loop NTPase fold protein [Methylovulum psychrotolerans]ASF45935.1 hypothetical protein CEK71_07500 [Methylovulum psychrotolerans]
MTMLVDLTTPKTIILDLTTNNLPTGNDSGSKDNTKLHLIQHEAFKTICEAINKRVEYYANPTRQKEFSDFNDDDIRGTVFFIDGTRGAGKTTFLKSVTKELTTDNNSKLALLIEIDPTQVETGEHIFLSVLYALKHLIDKQNQCRQFSIDEGKYEGWRKQLKKLAGGLQLLDEKNNPLQGIDEEAFLNWGLERAQSGMELAETFKKLIEDSCALLNKYALIISIDDADTNFSKGKQVLEMIRRYLDSPHLVVLITGDLQLYSQLVRNHYYEHMGKTIFERDKHRSDEQIKLIDHLEDQYLKKLFPLHQRAHLTPLWDLMKSPSYEYKVQYAVGASDLLTKPLDEIIDKLLQEGLYIKGERDLSLYREFLLKQPLRSVTQLLKFCTQNMEKGLFSPKHVVKGFRAMFRGSLHSHQIDVNALSAGDINALNDAVFRMVLEDGEFDTGCYLRPQPSKESLRNCFVALAAEVASHCEGRPDYAIDYMLQAQGSITLYNLVRELDSKQKEQRFRSYFSIGRNENALNWARHACGILASSTSNTRSVGSGVIGLKRYGLDKQIFIDHPPEPKGGVAYTSDSRAQLIADSTAQLTAESIITDLLCNGKIPIFALSRVNITDNDSQTYISIFNILGIAVKLLSINNATNATIHNELNQYLSVVTVSGLSWRNEKDNYKGFANRSTLKKDSKYSESFKSLVNNVIKWHAFVNSLIKQIRPSSILLGKIWTRFYFSLLNVDDKSWSSHESGAATIMELYATCLINAFFVEEHYYHYGSNCRSDIERTNPLETPIDDFIKKFTIADIKCFPLTRIIGTCPLILGLIKKDNANTLLNAMHNRSTPFKTESLGCDETAFELLNLALIANTPDHIVAKRIRAQLARFNELKGKSNQ